MFAVAKTLALPFLFILPIVWIKMNNLETSVREIVGSQPLLLVLLIPGLLIMIRPLLMGLWEQISTIKK